MALHPKGQMKMMETFGVMIVFFFLLMIGTTMYTRYQERQYQEDLDRAEELHSIQVAQKALFLPELKCVEEQLLCFDSMKIDRFNELTDTREDFQKGYSAMFGEANITVHQVYPDERDFTIYEQPADITKTHRLSITIVPITIHDPITKTNGFGVLKVVVY